MALPQPDFDVLNNALQNIPRALQELGKLRNLPVAQNVESINRLEGRIEALARTMEDSKTESTASFAALNETLTTLNESINGVFYVLS